MKGALLDLLRVTGAFAPFRLANRGKLLILTYHRFSGGEEGLRTSARALRGHLEYLVKRYRIVPLSWVAERLAGPGELPTATASITIDDGYRDCYEVAFPILREYNAPATIFVTTGFVDGQTWIWTDKLRFAMTEAPNTELAITVDGLSWKFVLMDAASRNAAAEKLNAACKELRDEVKDDILARVTAALGLVLPQRPPTQFAPLSWDEIREMESHGIEIGSHTVNHPILTGVRDDRLWNELHQSRFRLEAMLGHRVDLFCYPDGRYDTRVQDAVAHAGYRVAVTMDHGLNDRTSNPMVLRRVHAQPDLPHFVQSTSGFELVKSTMRRTWGQMLSTGIREGRADGSVET